MLKRIRSNKFIFFELQGRFHCSLCIFLESITFLKLLNYSLLPSILRASFYLPSSLANWAIPSCTDALRKANKIPVSTWYNFITINLLKWIYIKIHLLSILLFSSQNLVAPEDSKILYTKREKMDFFEKFPFFHGAWYATFCNIWVISNVYLNAGMVSAEIRF